MGHDGYEDMDYIADEWRHGRFVRCIRLHMLSCNQFSVSVTMRDLEITLSLQ